MGFIHGFNCCTDTRSESVFVDPRNSKISAASTGKGACYPTLSDKSFYGIDQLISMLGKGAIDSEILNRPARRSAERLLRDYSFEQVFLSHSDKQKNFVEQLYEDLIRENISCFFDKHSFRNNKMFDPDDILRVAQTCEVVIVVVSEDYIASELPMLELSAFVKAQRTINSKLKIYPLFYKMSIDKLYQNIVDFEKKNLRKFGNNTENSSQNLVGKWEALMSLRSFEGPLYIQREGIGDDRRKLVRDIRRLLSSDIRGKEHLCQDVANLFENAPYYTNGVKVIGLYGIAGSGKTTMCKSLCDFYSDKFGGKVFHAEFRKEGLPIRTLKGLVQVLGDADEESVKFVSSYEQALNLLKQRMRSQRVFLALDNTCDQLKSIQEARSLLNIDFGDGSFIVLTAQSAEILERVIPEEEKRSFMHVPSLTDEEAIEVLLNLTSMKASGLTIEEKDRARECTELCNFDRGTSFGQGNYHPLALTILGANLWQEFSSNLRPWPEMLHFTECHSGDDAHEKIFWIFEQSFDALDSECLHMFMLLAFYVPNFEIVENFDYFAAAFKWLADACYPEHYCQAFRFIGYYIHGMKKRGLIQWRGPHRISFHDLLVEFGQRKLRMNSKWISLEGGDEIPMLNGSVVEAIKFKDCKLIHSLQMQKNFDHLSVVHLESMPNLIAVDFPSTTSLRSITIILCRALKEIKGLEYLTRLRFLTIEGCDSLEWPPVIKDMTQLRHLKIQWSGHFYEPQEFERKMYYLEEIYLDGFSCALYPRYMTEIQAITFNDCDVRIELVDLTLCRKLEAIKLWNCKITSGQSTLNLTGCLNVRSIYLHKNDSITEIVGLVGLTALRELHLMEMINFEKLPSFRRLRNLRHLTLREMPKLKELPDLSKCLRLTKADIDINTGGR